MTTTTPLPEELLSAIFSHLDPKLDTATVLALRLVSKTCLRLAEPRTWWCITVKSEEACRWLSDGRFDNPVYVSGCRHWCARLDQSPRCAAYIKEFTLPDIPAYAEFDEKEDTSAGVPIRLLDSALLPPDLRERVEIGLQANNPSAYLVLLLAICLETESLTVATPFTYIPGLLPDFMAWATEQHRSNPSHSGTFSHVKHVTIDSKPSFAWPSLPLHRLSDFLPLPSLQSLRANSLSDPWQSCPISSGRYTAPASLELDKCLLTGRGLSQLLAALPEEVSLVARWVGGPKSNGICNAELGSAVRMHGKRLRHLLLDTTQNFGYFGRPAPEDPLGAFDSLTDLRTLVVPYSTFQTPGSETMTSEAVAAILPTSLEELYVLGDGTGFGAVYSDDRPTLDEPAFIKDLFFQREKLPNLRKVIQVPWYWYTWEDSYYSVKDRSIDYNLAPELGLSSASSPRPSGVILLLTQRAGIERH